MNPDDWDNKLTITSDTITFALKDGQSIVMPPKQITSISYGQEAHRRVGLAIGLAVVSLGIGALSALHKTKLHYIGINFTDKNGKKQGLLLQGDKSNYRAILVALQGVTGLPISVGEKDRNELPVGVTTQVSKESEEAQSGPTTNTGSSPPVVAGALEPAKSSDDSPATVSVSTSPDGAEIYLDGNFAGDAPANLKLRAGKHTIRVAVNGYKDWSRDITVQGGSEAHLTATLEKAN